jgi:hypothetical protein
MPNDSGGYFSSVNHLPELVHSARLCRGYNTDSLMLKLLLACTGGNRVV